MSSRLKALLLTSGTLLACGGIVFVVYRLRGQWSDLSQLHLDRAGWLTLGLLATVQAAANIMLARAWWSLLDFFGGPSEFSWSVRTYGVSQMARYVPGNVFQLAGRQALGLAAGIPGWALAKSSFWELASLALVGATFAILVVPSVLGFRSVVLPLTVFVITLATSVALVRWLIGPKVAVSVAWHACFLTVVAAVFIAVLRVLGMEIAWRDMPLVGSAYILGWLAGLATPGAPAGAGVRELVVIFLLDNLAQRDLVLAVVLFRAITIAGDVAFFLFSTSFWKRSSLPHAEVG